MSFVPSHHSSSCSALFSAWQGSKKHVLPIANPSASFIPPTPLSFKRFRRFCLYCVFACPSPQLSLNFGSLSSPHATWVSETPCLCVFQIKNIRTAHTYTEGRKEHFLVFSFCCLFHCLCVKIETERFLSRYLCSRLDTFYPLQYISI